MSNDIILFREIIRRALIGAKRENEACTAVVADPALAAEWRGQEIAFKQMLDILEQCK